MSVIHRWSIPTSNHVLTLFRASSLLTTLLRGFPGSCPPLGLPFSDLPPQSLLLVADPDGDVKFLVGPWEKTLIVLSKVSSLASTVSQLFSVRRIQRASPCPILEILVRMDFLQGLRSLLSLHYYLYLGETLPPPQNANWSDENFLAKSSLKQWVIDSENTDRDEEDAKMEQEPVAKPKSKVHRAKSIYKKSSDPQQAQNIVKEIEADTYEENPPLFREYISAPPDTKMVMDNQTKNGKTHARLLSTAKKEVSEGEE